MKNAEPLLNFAFWLNADSVSAPYCVFEYARPRWRTGHVLAGHAHDLNRLRAREAWLITVLNSVSELLDHVRTPFATVEPPFA